MKAKVDSLFQEIEKFTAKSVEEVEQFRIHMLGKKGTVTALFGEFRNVPNEEKKAFGQLLNELKSAAQDKVNILKEQFESAAGEEGSGLDLNRPGEFTELGSRHPISIVRNEIIDIFKRIGFTISEGPEIEDDWHNFSALNFPPEHPARDMQDTFLLKKEKMKKL